MSVTVNVLEEIAAERGRQDARWGEQNHPDGTGGPYFAELAEAHRDTCDLRHRNGDGSWADILEEEVYEGLACDDEEELRRELIQVAAVAVAWVEAIDRRRA